MKVRLVCMTCVSEANVIGEQYKLEFNDQNLYTFMCKNGHKTQTFLQECRYLMLFDTALLALEMGMPDLAIIRAYSAIESFEVFLIKLYCHHVKMNSDILKRITKDTHLSERKRGAFFLTIHLINNEFEALFPEIPNLPELANKRNKAAHSGVLYSHEEAKDYCQIVLSFLLKVTKWVDTNLKHETFAEFSSQVSDITPLSDQSLYIGTMTIPTICSRWDGDSEVLSVNEALNILKRNGIFVADLH